MSNNYFISAFGTFGNPNGFKQSYWFTNDRNIVNGIKTFDLNTNAIQLFPKSKLYSIRKEFTNSRNVITYSIYTYAKEPNSDRSGTFIGSSLLFINRIADETTTINCLNDFHNNLKNKNVLKDIITVNHSDNFIICEPKDFDKISSNLREIDNLNFVQTNNRQLVVYCETNLNKLQSYFKKSIDLLNVYDTVYFTESADVAEFVHQKSIFKLVKKEGLDIEIQKIEEDRLYKIQALFDELAKEKQKLNDEENKLIEEYKFKIEENQKRHQENERKIQESQDQLKNINQKYKAYSETLDELIIRLNDGGRLENIKQLHNENKRIFIDSINKSQISNFLDLASMPSARTDVGLVPSEDVQKEYYCDNKKQKEEKRRIKPEINFFKITTLVLILLWISTLAYFLLKRHFN